MRTHASDRIAAALVAAEGVGIAALVWLQLSAIAAGETGSVASAIALIVLTAVAAAAVFAFAVAIWRGRSLGRSGGIVTQLLILAVAVGAATGAYAAPSVALLLGIPALVTLLVLIVAVRAGARDAASD